MAPNFTPAQRELIRCMLSDDKLSCAKIANSVPFPCSTNAVKRIRANLKCYDSTTAPNNGGGRPKCLTSEMRSFLHAELRSKSYLYADEMADLLHKNFPDENQPSKSTIYRFLRQSGITRKVACRKAQQRDADLVDLYIHDLAAFSAEHLVFIDESGANRHDGFRRYAWSARGKNAVQVTRLQRGQRYQILPAYTQDGILLSRVFCGSTDSTIFKDFIAQLLTRCGRWPEPRSVLVMDNASIHHSADLEQMCADAGVKVIFLPPYAPNLNPIELFFGRLKKFIKRHACEYYDLR